MSLDPTSTYDDPTVLNALRAATGGRQVSFRYELLNEANRHLYDLDQVTAGSIAYDSTAEVKRTGQFTITEGGLAVDFLKDRVKPWMRLRMPDGGHVEWPLGVFLLSTPTRVLDTDGAVSRAVAAYDQGVILQADQVDDRYSVAAGTAYTTAIAAAVAGYGLTTNIVTSSLTLPVAIDWAGGTSKLTIVNDLLAAINYQAAWFDANGVFQAIPYVLPDVQDPIYTYATDGTSVIAGAISDTIDLFAVPNRWRLIVSDADRTVLTSVYTNTSTSSPTSTVNRGRTITSYLPGQSAADQTTLDALAKKQAYIDSQVFEVVDFATAIMPFHADLTVLGVSVDGLQLGSVKFQETAWSFALQAGALMSHSVRRSVAIL